MMMGLGVGGVAVGMFHLITHAFFKALLFLGAGSVIHGCSGEQDIRRMGGLRKSMRVTFLAYMAGMLALCGFPLLLRLLVARTSSSTPPTTGASRKPPSTWVPFGALLTAFYMTRQVYYVFAGSNRLAAATHDDPHTRRTLRRPRPRTPRITRTKVPQS